MEKAEIQENTEATAPPQPTAPTPQSPPPSTSLASQTIAIIALLLAVITAGGLTGLWWHSEQRSHHYSARFHKFEALTQQQFTTQQQLAQQLMQTQNQLLQQQNNLASMQTNLQKILQGQPGYNRAWTLAEVDSTVHLANLELQINHSVPNAILLLQTANERLTKLSDTTLTSLIQTINSNLSALQSLPVIDVADINTRINHLQDEISQLPQSAEPTIAKPNTPQNETTVTTESWWRKIVLAIHQELKKFVVIKYHNQQSPELLPPGQLVYLQQNLQLMLEQAQWAALQHNQTVYSNSLQQVKNLIDKYYVQDAQATKAIMQDITSLQQINLQPTYPDLTATFNMINVAKTANSQSTQTSR